MSTATAISVRNPRRRVEPPPQPHPRPEQTAAEVRKVTVFGNVDLPIPATLREPGESMLRDTRHGEGEMLFTILTPRDGDKRLLWNRHSIPEIEDARKLFDDLVAQGMIPHRVGRDGEPTAEILSSFDPILEEIALLDNDEQKARFPGSTLLQKLAKLSEVVFLPRRQLVGG